MIRDKFFKSITQTINSNERFDSTEFKIESGVEQKGSATILSVKYNIEPKYKIVFKIPSTTIIEKSQYGSDLSVYSFSGSVCPGPVAIQETFSFTGEQGVFERIKTWLNCIWEELSSNPIVKQIENQQSQIDEIVERFDTIKDEYFSDSEAVELKQRLDELEETLKTEIQSRNEDKKEFESEIGKLHTDIDTLKQTISSFKKKGWLTSFTTKVFKWTKDSENRKLFKDGYKVIKEFLPEHVKISLPE